MLTVTSVLSGQALWSVGLADKFLAIADILANCAKDQACLFTRLCRGPVLLVVELRSQLLS